MMKTKFRLQPLLLLYIILGLSLLYAQNIKLKVIETSDLHGSIFPYDFSSDRPANSSLAQVHTYVQQERSKADQEVILLDNGDILQGQPVVYYYNFEKTKAPHILAQVMNYMNYDAATVGNHDIETGHPVYDRFHSQLKFPWLAANAVRTKTGRPYFTPYKIINKKGVKIAVLGLITPAIPHWLPEKIWAGMEFEDMIESAGKWMKIIKEKEKPDVIIGLFHAGVEYTYNNQTADQKKNENASQLVAERVAGFDIVFTGHDHKVWNMKVKDPEGKDVVITGPNNAARTAASVEIDLQFNKESRKWDKKLKAETIDIKDYKADSLFMAKFSPAMEEARKYVSKPVGNFTRTISTRESMFGSSPFMDLIHTIQLELTKADVSFAAPLSFDARIDKGTIYVRDMFRLYRYENLLYTMMLSGAEIKGFLEHSYNLWFNQMKDENDHLMAFRKEADGTLVKSKEGNYELKAQFYNFDCAAGINYTVDVSKPSGSRITIHSMSDGKPFDMNKKYKTAINSYRGNGGGNHLTLGAGLDKEEISKRIITSTEKDLRFFMMKWIERKKTVEPRAFNNWKVVPEEWYKKGREKDFPLLYK